MAEAVPPLNPTPEAEPAGFLGLYHAHTGAAIPASTEDLMRIEAHDFDLTVHQRVFADYAGDHHTLGVLISNRPGYIAQALVVSVWPSPDRPEQRWEVSFMTNGMASYPHWTVDGAIEAISSHVQSTFGSHRGTPLAPNVEQLIREHVAYREAKDPTPDPLDLWGVTTLDEDAVRRNLIALSDVDPGFLVALAGKRSGIFELGLAVVDFCVRAGLEGREGEVFARILPDDQQERLTMQMEAADSQFGGEESDTDDEFRRLLGE